MSTPNESYGRQLNRIEALVCFALSYLTAGWLQTFWVVAGFVTLFNLDGLVIRAGVRRWKMRAHSHQGSAPS